VNADPRAVASRRHRRILAGLFFAAAVVLFALLLRALLHDHAGEPRMAHEWDPVAIPVIATMALVPVFIGIGLWRPWTWLRTGLWIVASPLLGWALLFPFLWLQRLVNPLPL
jgi:hypothetical protein